MIFTAVVVSVHAALHKEEEQAEASDEVNQMEEEVVDRITHLLASRSQADSSRIWELVQLRLIGVRVGRSVVLFFHCQNLLDLDELRLSYTSGDLRQKVDTVFHRLLCRGTQVLLKWPDDDYAEFRNHFCELLLSSCLLKKTKLEPIKQCLISIASLWSTVILPSCFVRCVALRTTDQLFILLCAG